MENTQITTDLPATEVALEVPVREVRAYVKRQRKFNLQEQNAIVRSVKEVGVVETARRFNTLYIRVAKIVKGRRVKVALGRRPLPKALPLAA